MEKQYENVTPVFKIKPVNTTSVIVKIAGYLENDQKLVDELIEFDQSLLKPERVGATKNVINFGIIDGFVVTGRIYRCSIVGAHIVASYRYPLIYLDISYDKPMVSGSLFQLFYSIDTDKDQKKQIKHNKQYVNHQFSGKWVRHIDCDDEMKDNIRDLEKITEDATTTAFYTSNLFGKDSQTLPDEKIVDMIEEYVNREMESHKSLIKDEHFEFRSLNHIINDILNICNSDNIINFIKYGIDQRREQRRKKYGVNDSTEYTVPKNITSLSDLRQELLESGELIIEDA